MDLTSIEMVWGSSRSYYKVGMQECSRLEWDLTKNVVYVYYRSNPIATAWINLNNVVSFNVELA